MEGMDEVDVTLDVVLAIDNTIMWSVLKFSRFIAVFSRPSDTDWSRQGQHG